MKYYRLTGTYVITFLDLIFVRNFLKKSVKKILNWQFYKYIAKSYIYQYFEEFFQIDLNIAFMYLYRREILCWTQKWLQIKSKSNGSHDISTNVTFFENFSYFSKNVTFFEISWDLLDLELLWSHFWVQHKISRR